MITSITSNKYFFEIIKKNLISIGGDKKKLDTFHYRNTINVYVDKILGLDNETFDYSQVFI